MKQLLKINKFKFYENHKSQTLFNWEDLGNQLAEEWIQPISIQILTKMLLRQKDLYFSKNNHNHW